MLNQQCKDAEDKEGLGIGLAIVKKIIELYNCTLHVNSEHNKFTVFEIGISQSETNKKYEDEYISYL